MNAHRPRSTAQARLLDDARAVNGERPGWDDERGLLWWVDMRKPALHAFDPASRAKREWPMPAWIGTFALCRDGRLAVALRTGVCLFDPEDGSLKPLAATPYDQAVFCFNDGRCDRQGRFIVGPLHHPQDHSRGGRQTAPLWRLEHGVMKPLPLPPVKIANGLAFSPDGRILYHSDTAQKTVFACDYDPATGEVARQRVFVRVDAGGDNGGPDGAIVDAEGFYTCAVFGAGALFRFDPDGRLERRIALPARYPTMPALGGPDRRTLYVTSASYPWGARAGAHPDAGGLLALEAPAPGLPTSYLDLAESLP
ncbi:MAG TPA: SMP-30/gluconolactonase/LRE family protein [Caulobacteraceae bacterium]|nr:SMP-30/gluconolactonase/LRE family protein [Caulobacteraceae bacterium]